MLEMPMVKTGAAPLEPPREVRIVKARTAGIQGYTNVGRGTAFGNPYVVGMLEEDLEPATAADCVRKYELYIDSDWSRQFRAKVEFVLSKEYPGGIVTIACPCNGYFKNQPCHATVVKERLEEAIKAGSHGEAILAQAVAQILGTIVKERRKL